MAGLVYGRVSSELKPLDEVELPDPRFEYLVMQTQTSSRPFTLEDLHARIGKTNLHATTPEDVYRQFQVARNLMLYAWHVFEFQTVAAMQAYATLELALRTRFPDAVREIKGKDGSIKRKPHTLGPLLEHAVAQGAFFAEKLPAWEWIKANHARLEADSAMPTGSLMEPAEWLKYLARSLPSLRNSLAHGKPWLDIFGSLHSLELCADLINALFPADSPTP